MSAQSKLRMEDFWSLQFVFLQPLLHYARVFLCGSGNRTVLPLVDRGVGDSPNGTEEIEGIHLDLSEPVSLKISLKAFTNMKNLRLLKIHNVNIEQMPASFPRDLQWLDLHKYKTRTLPPNFQGEKLVGLKLKHSYIEHLGGLEKAESVSFLNCSKLFENPENHNAADKLLHSLLQGQPVIDGRFSILIPGREVPESFSYQKMGCSVTIPLTPDWHENVIGFAVSIVFERLVSKSKIRVTFKLISRDHGEFTPNITQTATKLNENCESAHVWIGYISFHLFQRLFPKFQSDDWAKIEGCLSISTTEESWIKPKGCGIRLVYKEEVKEALAQYVETRPGNSEVFHQESSKSKEAEESIAALTYGVNQLNWIVDPAEEEGTQIQSLRNSTAFKWISFQFGDTLVALVKEDVRMSDCICWTRKADPKIEESFLWALMAQTSWLNLKN
ncbi:TMV resistance protein N-like [Forsythia ovata]|uniref:TMV resistance protein N-like n=1 Tax=Forsythia ovata TaxID=205694 RepID=A0ABD1RNE1_9LAMI